MDINEERFAQSNLLYFLEKAKKIVAQETNVKSFNCTSNARLDFNKQLIEDLTKEIKKRVIKM